jgi:competence ComEA-like helix-hairpin-helix protein
VCKEETAAAPRNSKTTRAGELQQVPGFGPSTAEKTAQVRNSSGTFKRVDDLRVIQGIGPKQLDKRRKCLIVSNPQHNKKHRPMLRLRRKALWLRIHPLNPPQPRTRLRGAKQSNM